MRRRNHRKSQRGASAIEFALSLLFWVPMIMGVSVTGLNLIRSLQVNQVCRDAAHMFAYGIDFADNGNKDLLLRTATGLNITRTGGSGVVILSRLMYVGASECTGAGLAANAITCPNINKTVFTRRLVIGNSALRASVFGTPISSIVQSDGNITAANYLTKPSAVATNFTLMSLTGGQILFMAETFFASRDFDWNGVTADGEYARVFF